MKLAKQIAFLFVTLLFSSHAYSENYFSAKIECSKTSNNKNLAYEANLVGLSISNAFVMLRKGGNGTNFFEGYIKDKKLIIRGIGRNNHNSDEWEYFFSKPYSGNIIQDLKEGLTGREGKGGWKRNCEIYLTKYVTTSVEKFELLKEQNLNLFAELKKNKEENFINKNDNNYTTETLNESVNQETILLLEEKINSLEISNLELSNKLSEASLNNSINDKIVIENYKLKEEVDEANKKIIILNNNLSLIQSELNNEISQVKQCEINLNSKLKGINENNILIKERLSKKISELTDELTQCLILSETKNVLDEGSQTSNQLDVKESIPTYDQSDETNQISISNLSNGYYGFDNKFFNCEDNRMGYSETCIKKVNIERLCEKLDGVLNSAFLYQDDMRPEFVDAYYNIIIKGKGEFSWLGGSINKDGFCDAGILFTPSNQSYENALLYMCSVHIINSQDNNLSVARFLACDQIKK